MKQGIQRSHLKCGHVHENKLSQKMASKETRIIFRLYKESQKVMKYVKKQKERYKAHKNLLKFDKFYHFDFPNIAHHVYILYLPRF